MPTEKKPQKPRASLKKHVDARAESASPRKPALPGPKPPTKPDAPTAAATNERGTAKGGIAKAGTAKPPRPNARSEAVVLGALDDMKALEVKVLDVRGSPISRITW